MHAALAITRRRPPAKPLLAVRSPITIPSDALQPTWLPADTRAPRRRVQSEQMRQLQDTFDKFDAGRKGQLSVRELGACCRCFGYVATEADLQEMVSCNL